GDADFHPEASPVDASAAETASPPDAEVLDAAEPLPDVCGDAIRNPRTEACDPGSHVRDAGLPPRGCSQAYAVISADVWPDNDCEERWLGQGIPPLAVHQTGAVAAYLARREGSADVEIRVVQFDDLLHQARPPYTLATTSYGSPDPVVGALDDGG